MVSEEAGLLSLLFLFNSLPLTGVHIYCRFFLLRRSSRPQLLQNIIDMRKRLKEAPTGGTVSLVVTSIPDMSGTCDLEYNFESMRTGIMVALT